MAGLVKHSLYAEPTKSGLRKDNRGTQVSLVHMESDLEWACLLQFHTSATPAQIASYDWQLSEHSAPQFVVYGPV